MEVTSVKKETRSPFMSRDQVRSSSSPFKMVYRHSEVASTAEYEYRRPSGAVQADKTSSGHSGASAFVSYPSSSRATQNQGYHFSTNQREIYQFNQHAAAAESARLLSLEAGREPGVHRQYSSTKGHPMCSPDESSTSPTGFHPRPAGTSCWSGASSPDCCCPHVEVPRGSYRKRGSNADLVRTLAEQSTMRWRNMSPYSTDPYSHYPSNSRFPCTPMGPASRHPHEDHNNNLRSVPLASSCSLTDLSVVDRNSIEIKLNFFGKAYSGVLTHNTSPPAAHPVQLASATSTSPDPDQSCTDDPIDVEGTTPTDTTQPDFNYTDPRKSDSDRSAEIAEPFPKLLVQRSIPHISGKIRQPGPAQNSAHFIMVPAEKKRSRLHHVPPSLMTTMTVPRSRPSRQGLEKNRKLHFHYSVFSRPGKGKTSLMNHSSIAMNSKPDSWVSRTKMQSLASSKQRTEQPAKFNASSKTPEDGPSSPLTKQTQFFTESGEERPPSPFTPVESVNSIESAES